MKLSGLAGFLLYDALQRCGVSDGRTFCLKEHSDVDHPDAELPPNGDRVAILRWKHTNGTGYHVEVDRPGKGDRVAVFREQTVLAVGKDLFDRLKTTKLDARLEGDTITLMLCTDIGWCVLPNDYCLDMER